MDAQFYTNLDSLYQFGKMEQAESYLSSTLNAAKNEQNVSDQITILNELIGFYRVQGNLTSCKEYCDELLALIQTPELKGTLPYATVLLNIANAYRVIGLYDESKAFFSQVEDIYSKTLPENDYRIASLYNNLSLVYQATKEYQEAIDTMEKALLIIRAIPGAFIEEASTYTNLANVLLECDQIDSALDALSIATGLFERNDATADMHYSATLSAMAHANFCAEKYDDALFYYKKAAAIIESLSGKTKNYATLYKNISRIYEKLGKQKEAEDALNIADQVISALNR